MKCLVAHVILRPLSRPKNLLFRTSNNKQIPRFARNDGREGLGMSGQKGSS